MQVVILCGGEGTRIRDVAEDVPKPMIPVGDRPILWHIMKGFAHHGFRDFVLCLGYKSWVIKRFFMDYRLQNADFSLEMGRGDRPEVHSLDLDEDWRVTLAETGSHAMTGCRLKRVAKYLSGDHFLLTYGDAVADIDVHRLLAFHRHHGKIGTLTAVRQPGRFGELELDGARVTDFTEKPLVSRGWINGGFYVFRREFLDRLEDDPELVLEKGPLTRLTADDQLMAYLHHGCWQCMDNSRDFKHLNDLWSRGEAAWKVWDPTTPVRRAA
jgi:glucose-1-phosphate cytidylyltransferase